MTNVTGRPITVAFGDAANPNVCYVGMKDGNIAMTSNITVPGGGFVPTTFKAASGGELPQDMVIDPNDPATLYVVTESSAGATHVLVTFNSGATWTSLTDNLDALTTPGFPLIVDSVGATPQRSIALVNNGTVDKTDDVLLVGGPGQSFLYGGAGQDVMIAGTTAFDANDVALTDILDEWMSGNSFATRLGHLQGTIPGGLNGTSLLTAATVKNNGVINYLFAGLGQDWFFAHVGGGLLYQDVLVRKPIDTVTMI